MINNDFLFQFEPEWRSLDTPQHAPVLEHTVTAAVSAGLNGSTQSVVYRLEDCVWMSVFGPGWVLIHWGRWMGAWGELGVKRDSHGYLGDSGPAGPSS